MSDEAARIMNALAKRGGKASTSPFQLATVMSAAPVSVRIDGMEYDITQESLMINAQLVAHSVVGALEECRFSINDPERPISGPGSVAPCTAKIPAALADGDRALVLRLGMNCWVIMCKVVDA